MPPTTHQFTLLGASVSPRKRTAGLGLPVQRRSTSGMASCDFVRTLNPKVALFFLAFLPQFVDPAAGAPVPQIVFLGLLFNIQGTLVNIAVALLASRTTHWLRSSERSVSLLQRLTGALFVALGARLALVGNR